MAMVTSKHDRIKAQELHDKALLEKSKQAFRDHIEAQIKRLGGGKFGARTPDNFPKNEADMIVSEYRKAGWTVGKGEFNYGAWVYPFS